MKSPQEIGREIESVEDLGKGLDGNYRTLIKFTDGGEAESIINAEFLKRNHPMFTAEQLRMLQDREVLRNAGASEAAIYRFFPCPWDTEVKV